MNYVNVIRLAAAIGRAGDLEEVRRRIVIRLSPSEWANFRRQLDPSMVGELLSERTFTSCTFYGIKVEVDPDAA